MATIKKIAQQLGWEYQKNYMYGSIGNYLITARQVIDFSNVHNNCKLVYVPLINISEDQKEKLLNYLKDNKKEIKIFAYEFSGHVLVVRLMEAFKGYNLGDFNNLTSKLISFLQMQDIGTTASCVYCGSNNVSTTSKVDKIVYYSHNDCALKALNDLKETQENFKNVDKKYGVGMVGAMVFALIGAIPWLLLELIWGYSAVLSLLIGYAAFYGYKKFGGVVTSLTKWLVLLSVVFAVITSNIINITIFFISNNFLVIIENYLIAYTDSQILTGLGLSILFGLLGYISVYKQIKSEELNSTIE